MKRQVDREDILITVNLAFLLAAGFGYVMNLVAIAHWTEGTGMLVLRCIGAFIAPLGVILGWVF